MWLNGGTPKDKLIVGMGLYGRSFEMASSDHRLGAPASGAGTAGKYTREAGFLSYYEVDFQMFFSTIGSVTLFCRKYPKPKKISLYNDI
jgi:GH18 family chitinase